MTHRNTFLTPRGRLALVQCVVEDGWTLRRAAERFNCSPARPRNGPTATATAARPR